MQVNAGVVHWFVSRPVSVSNATISSIFYDVLTASEANHLVSTIIHWYITRKKGTDTAKSCPCFVITRPTASRLSIVSRWLKRSWSRNSSWGDSWIARVWLRQKGRADQ
jgi:hypothetical protein